MGIYPGGLLNLALFEHSPPGNRLSGITTPTSLQLRRCTVSHNLLVLRHGPSLGARTVVEISPSPALSLLSISLHLGSAEFHNELGIWHGGIYIGHFARPPIEFGPVRRMSVLIMECVDCMHIQRHQEFILPIQPDQEPTLGANVGRVSGLKP